MADTYIINASNQTVTGTAAGEIFEFDSSLTNGTFTNVIINAAGGKDTIKAGTQSATRQTIDAVVTGLNPSSRLDFGDTYGDNFFYFSTQPDGIHITNENGTYKFKLLGVTNTSICTGDTKNIFRALQQTTPWDDYRLGGTELADTLTVNHARCKATGRSGDDVIISSDNFSLLEGSEGNDIIINTGNNGTLRGDNDNDVLICSGSNNVLQGGYGNDIVINTGNNCTLHGEAGDDILICGGTNNTLTGNNGYNTYIMSTGLVGVDGSQVGTAPYNPNFSDTVNVTITDAESGDSYYMRDFGIGGINMSTTSDGIVISSTSGRINVTLKNCDWNAVKDNLISRDTAQGYIYTCSLERAVLETAARLIPPEGISVSGNYLSVSADFVGNLIISSATVRTLSLSARATAPTRSLTRATTT